MLVKVFIRRVFKKGKNKEVLALLNEFRSGAMNRPGYVSGETLVAHDDPRKLLVIGTWQGMDYWLAWKENSVRKNFEKMLELYQEEPTAYETWVLGAPLRD
jgi:quinol monooxygenase YgiN